MLPGSTPAASAGSRPLVADAGTGAPWHGPHTAGPATWHAACSCSLEAESGNAAVNITQYGRVEADLSRVPVPASMRTGHPGSFADTLRSAEAVPSEPRAQRRREETAPPALEQAVPPPPDEPAAAVEAGAAIPPAAPRELPRQATLAPVAEHPAVATFRRGGPAPVGESGNGAGSPLTSTGRPAAAGPARTTPAATAAPATHAIPVAASSPGQGHADARALGAALREIKAAPARAPASVAGYRSMTPQAMQMLEQSRDSVFKQILFRLKDGGGEMRLRLDPPELGQLDLRVAVDKAGQMKLYIAAERPELAAMLDRSLDALRQTLHQQGLQVVHAEVHGGPGSRRGGSEPAGPEGWFDGEAEADDRAPAPLARGWIGAEGFDFWV
jgi:hypothetical protein